METPSAPQTLQPGFRANLRHDLPAGIVVFLVALPLCLGIALASEAPLISGLVTGALAGLVVAWLSGSELSVSGPAAGLAVVVAGAIATLGSYEAFLLALLVAGVLQVLLGALGAGVLAGFFPSSVIKGMLAGIGVIIVLKQIPHALGSDADYEGDLGFWAIGGSDNTFTDLVIAARTGLPAAIAIALGSAAILLLWGRPAIQRHRLLASVPGPLLAVIFGVVANEAIRALAPQHALQSAGGHLVNLPVPQSLAEVFQGLRWPDFGAWKNPGVYSTGLTMAVVASLETLLCIEATDKLDPFRRISSKGRELVAQGIGNSLAALLGGLPMTSVIVRSSANVYAGARTRLACFVHGVLLAAAVVAVPALLNRIPLASLAAVLILVGYKLASVKLFREMWRQGVSQFVPFVATVVAITFTDLLTGVLIGFAFGLFVVIKSNFYSAITTASDGKDLLIKFTKDVSFVNTIRLKRELAQIPDGSRVLIDGTRAFLIDHDVQELIEEFRATAPLRGIGVEVKGVEGKQYPLGARARRT